MSTFVSTSTSSPSASDLLRMASQKPRPNGKPPRGVITESDLKAGVKSATGIDLNAAKKQADVNGDGSVTAGDLAVTQSANNAKIAAKLDTNRDGKVTKAEVTANAELLSKSRDTNGDGKVSKDENVAAAKKLAAQLDSEYDGMRLKGFSRQEVNSQLGSIASTGASGGVVAATAAYEVSEADSNSDGQINSSEAKDYVDSKTGISDKVKKFEKTREDEKTQKAEESKKSDEAKETKKADEKKAEKSEEQRTKLSQTYGSSDNNASRTHSISVSA